MTDIDTEELVNRWLGECTDGRCHKDTIAILKSYTRWLSSELGGLSYPEESESQHPDEITVIKKELATLRLAQQRRGIESAPGSFQSRVEPWFRECFPPHVCDDRLERCDRFIEEALELVQAAGYSAERAHALVDYTFSRPKGEINQEVGGVMVTLAALCIAHGLDMHQGGETELARISQPEVIAKIRAKQAAKPTGSALPVAQPGDAE